VAIVGVWPARRVRTADNNGDGRPDVWRLYDGKGQLTEVDVDSNFDGHTDIQEYYEQGVLVRRESDRNFNGQSDLVEEFDAKTHHLTRSVIDLDYDGTADLLVLFRDGQPVFSRRAAPLPVRTANRDLPAAHHGDVSGLTRLTDPFESEIAVRAVHMVATDEGCVGLSTSGGLPRPHVTFDRPTVPARLAARDGRLLALALPLARSPRAPPVSSPVLG